MPKGMELEPVELLMLPDYKDDLEGTTQQIEAICAHGNSLAVSDQGELVVASEFAIHLNEKIKECERWRRHYKEPALEMGREVDATANKLAQPLRDCFLGLQNRITAYNKEQKEKADIANAQKMRAFEDDVKATGFTRDKRIPTETVVPRTTEVDAGKATVSDVRKYRVIDFSILPDLYKQENKEELNRACKAGIVSIPGVDFYMESTLRTRARRKK